MADTEPGHTTPATGMPDPTRVSGSSDEPPTGVLPSRWSGAAPVPEIGPRRSLWGRLVDRVTGEPEQPDDHWATMPAVDPWAGQDTPVWTTEHLTPVEMPPTRIDAPTTTQRAVPAPVAAPASVPTPAKPDLPAKVRALVDALTAKAAAAQKARVSQAAPTAVPPKSSFSPVPGAPPPPAAGGGRPPGPRGWFGRPKASPPPSRVPVQPRPPEANRPPWAAPRPRRRHRRLRRLLLIIAVLAAMWFGAPFAYDQWPALAQFPVSASLPERVGDLRLRADAASQKAVERLADQLEAAGSEGQAFAGVYGDGNGKRVTLYGVTGWRFTPRSDVTGQLARIAGDAKLTDVQDFAFDESGAYESCGAGRLNGTATVICTWADHGSMATVLLTRRSVTESAEVVARLRGAVLTPKFGA